MELVFDEKIRDFVFLPLVFIMFLIGIVRRYISIVMKGGRTEIPKVTTENALQELKINQLIGRSRNLRSANVFLTKDAFNMRKHTLSSTNEGVLRTVKAPEQGDAMEKMMSNPMMNPNMMGGMLKNNLFMTIMTPLQYGLINHFFSGFIIGKVPFPLTQTFRSMLQSGVSVIGLDVKYVSSLSLYFLSFSGFNSIYQMIFQGKRTKVKDFLTLRRGRRHGQCDGCHGSDDGRYDGRSPKSDGRKH